MEMAESKNLAMAVQADREKALEQFRLDFKFMWRWWRHCGEISEIEMEQGMKESAAEIRGNKGDPEWMRSCCSHFAQMACDARADIARSERIRDEVRAEREAA